MKVVMPVSFSPRCKFAVALGSGKHHKQKRHMATNAKAQAKTNPMIDHTRALILGLAMATTAPLRDKKDQPTEEQQKEIAALQTLLKTDPHLAKLCADGFGIPGVKLVAFITGKDYLNRAFPNTAQGVRLPAFAAMKNTANGHLLLTTQPYDNTQTYALAFHEGKLLSDSFDAYAFHNEQATPATDEEIKTVVGLLPDTHLDKMLVHKSMGPVLRAALFAPPVSAESPATAPAAK